MTEPSLTEFLLERIAEDEAAAIHAQANWEGPPEQWEVRHGLDNDTLRRVGAHLTITAAELGRLIRGADHIARWDPARVLAECEMKRRLAHDMAQEYSGGYVLKLLASVYSDHPDYDESWRP